VPMMVPKAVAELGDLIVVRLSWPLAGAQPSELGLHRSSQMRAFCRRVAFLVCGWLDCRLGSGSRCAAFSASLNTCDRIGASPPSGEDEEAPFMVHQHTSMFKGIYRLSRCSAPDDQAGKGGCIIDVSARPREKLS
jgi:hypothetical protein